MKDEERIINRIQDSAVNVGQTRRRSLLESFVNILVGYSINFTANLLIFPIFGWHISTRENLTLGVIYTGISLVRSYGLRRFFNRNECKKNKMTDKERIINRLQNLAIERIINRLQNLAIEKSLNMENCQDIADVYEKHFCKNTKNIVSKQEKQNDSKKY